ncbi:glycosyl hydrolase-related protein [Spiroplasma clarkii]|uniref:glycosyl hydrolase-related protein n=1 Tax=Spiroplasma clarkii TaxID=2139 RepID=UPI0021500DF4|nr:glycosyl hydrolase-related protein [Spiroplasma clarkii]
MSEDGSCIILRVFNPTEELQNFEIEGVLQPICETNFLEKVELPISLKLQAYEIKTYKLKTRGE